MNLESPPDYRVRYRAACDATLVPHASMLPLGEQFLLWALRQWQCEVALWDAEQRLPEGGSLLRRGFDQAGLRQALPHFALVMDAVLCGVRRPLEIYPPTAPIVSPDEGTLLALFGLAQDGLSGPLASCLSAMLPPSNCAVATVQSRLLAVQLKEAGLASAGCKGWIH
ncbi:MAG: hypothetical protein JSR91_05475 [Proteobacteria bacterium]|nr:hypothetical protein [Pseudomonadota bacterium]